MAMFFESFLVHWFDIEAPYNRVQEDYMMQAPVMRFYQKWMIKHVKRHLNVSSEVDFEPLHAWMKDLIGDVSDTEHAVATIVMRWVDQDDQDALGKALQWTIAAYHSDEGKIFTQDWVSFALTRRVDFDALVPVQAENDVLVYEGDLRQRDGFALTDEGASLRAVQKEAHYCVLCHKTENDHCRTGFPEKKGSAILKENSLGNVLTGCPLDERISEMHALRRGGHIIGALAMAMRDNPMIAMTGHRICNDCMKACIYQKQDPVDIPQVESATLRDVLALPYGVELFLLMMQWNPLRRARYVPELASGKTICVMGMGPAGCTMAHEMMMRGHGVLGLDGLKIESLSSLWISEPIESYATIHASLDTRSMHGLGGVAEYGITVRWDKNYLALVYLSLVRRSLFQVFGGVRFGGTVCIDDVWSLGVDHLTLAVGAGLPQALPIKNSMALGMRQANDFLMYLQLTGAAKQAHITRLQVRMPILVIGGGLTAVDAATEAQAYYLQQIEKVVSWYETLIHVSDETKVRCAFDEAQLEVLDELLLHGRALLELRKEAASKGQAPDLISLVHSWGGVHIVYRKSMQASPAYRLNHIELKKAMEEGICYRPYLQPSSVLCDDYHWVRALMCQHVESGESVCLEARTVLVATGAKPNVSYGFEHGEDLKRQRFSYMPYQYIDGRLVSGDHVLHCKQEEKSFLTSYEQQGRYVSFIGDTHPTYHGSVVKAIASAKDAARALEALPWPEGVAKDFDALKEGWKAYFMPKVCGVECVDEHFTALHIYAPAHVKRFLPGHAYRIQAFESHLPQGSLQTDNVSLTPYKVDVERHVLTFWLSVDHVQQYALSFLEEGMPVALMGPSGVRTDLPEQVTECLVLCAEGSIG